MIATQGDVFDVPVALGTILTIREPASYQRSLYFRNISSNTLAVQIEESDDGGSSWSIVGTAFSLGAGIILVKEVAATVTGILRIRASGGGDDRDLHLEYSRAYDDTSHIWASPTL